jgi:hypothetical protein
MGVSTVSGSGDEFDGRLYQVLIISCMRLFWLVTCCPRPFRRAVVVLVLTIVLVVVIRVPLPELPMLPRVPGL